MTFDEFYVLLSKNKVSADPESTLKWFRELDQDNDNLLSILDFQNILGQDLVSLNISELSEPELILRLALEIFNCLGEDSHELDLKKTMHFIKFTMKEEIDFVNLLMYISQKPSRCLDSCRTYIMDRSKRWFPFRASCRRSAPNLRNALAKSF